MILLNFLRMLNCKKNNAISQLKVCSIKVKSWSCCSDSQNLSRDGKRKGEGRFLKVNVRAIIRYFSDI
jgi:hypothetical protein